MGGSQLSGFFYLGPARRIQFTPRGHNTAPPLPSHLWGLCPAHSPRSSAASSVALSPSTLTSTPRARGSPYPVWHPEIHRAPIYSNLVKASFQDQSTCPEATLMVTTPTALRQGCTTIIIINSNSSSSSISISIHSLTLSSYRDPHPPSLSSSHTVALTCRVSPLLSWRTPTRWWICSPRRTGCCGKKWKLVVTKSPSCTR